MRSRILFLFLFVSTFSFSQNAQFDRLEMLYAQHHFKAVYRKANRLIDIPDYDYSNVPKYYRNIAILQLAQNEYWLKRNPSSFIDAKEALLKIKSTANGSKLFVAHQFELSALKTDLLAYAEKIKNNGDEQQFQLIHEILSGLFQETTIIKTEPVIEKDTLIVSTVSKSRDELIAYAKKFIGTPYVWAGVSPKGFDCSGFTTYVFEASKVKLPRRAMDQQASAKKVKLKNVKAGDLIFFSNGGGVSHVGIVVSRKGQEVVMIHASSSQGIVITNVTSSTYWSKRVHSYGSFLD